jgi:hypothetical protein
VSRRNHRRIREFASSFQIIGSNAIYDSYSSNEGINNGRTGFREIDVVSRNYRQTVDHRGRSDEVILDRHCFPGFAKTRQQFPPFQAGLRTSQCDSRQASERGTATSGLCAGSLAQEELLAHFHSGALILFPETST